jgi:hypothetical protein
MSLAAKPDASRTATSTAFHGFEHGGIVFTSVVKRPNVFADRGMQGLLRNSSGAERAVRLWLLSELLCAATKPPVLRPILSGVSNEKALPLQPCLSGSILAGSASLFVLDFVGRSLRHYLEDDEDNEIGFRARDCRAKRGVPWEPLDRVCGG